MSANPISVAVTLAPAAVGSTTDVKVVTMDVMSGGGEGAGGDGSTTRRRRRGRRRQTQKGGGEVEGGDTGEGQVDVQKIVPAPGAPAYAPTPAPAPASAIIQPKPVAMQLGGATKRVGAGSAVVATQQQQPPKVIIAPPKKKPVKIMLVPKKPGVAGAATAAPVRPPKKFTARRVHVTIDNTSKTQKRRRMTIQRIDALTETQLQEAAVLAKLSRAETVKKVPADLLRQMLKDYHMMRGALI